ncbi:DNA adenine methylase [Knoellia subterranea]|uniref:DNA adenine methylase n=1 Tax=Knoellia subterranea TaxID=184882 RepID=UPI0014705DC7
MGVRYIGNKARVADAILDLAGDPGDGRFVDAFCGTGSVAAVAASRGWAVTLNDALPSAVAMGIGRSRPRGSCVRRSGPVAPAGRPKVSPGATTKTAAVVSAARGEEMLRSCQPGSSPWSVIVRSSSPERSTRVRNSRSPIVTVTGSPAAGVVKKTRHPLRSLSAVRSSSHVARASAAAGA